MKILSIHNKYLIKGGEDENRESEETILRENNISVYSYMESNIIFNLDIVGIKINHLY